MKLRVKYYKDMGKWIGEVQDDDTMKWLMKTYGGHTKYGAKRELRKWYKREVAPEKIEEIDPADLVLSLIHILNVLPVHFSRDVR